MKTDEETIAYLKGELAYLELQRDALLEITWLDLPDEPDESIAKWKEQFNKGWMRRADAAIMPTISPVLRER